MPTIDPSKISPEIASKYSIVSNALMLDKVVNAELDIYKNEPKDEINIEVGDTKQTEFYPQVKLERWREVNFSVRLKDTEYEKATITTEADKIKWSKGNIDIEYYDYEGGYKMVWFLKEKPLTNKVEFSLQSKDVVFYYQPELTQKEIDEGSFRPENVIGSYAVYAETPKTNWVGGKLYRVGKVGHIYRPRLKDAEGKEEWGILNIDKEAGTYTVEIPQDFLDNAVYPIRSNDTFGNESGGGSSSFYSINRKEGSWYQSNGEGEITKLSIYTVNAGAASYKIRACVFLKSDGSVNAYGSETTFPSYQPLTWYDYPTNTVSLGVSDATDYWLAIWPSSGITAYYDDTTANKGLNVSETYHATNAPSAVGATPTTQNYEFSIYATYTPSGGGTNITIDGAEVTSITIDGDPVVSVTIDGTTVF